MKANKTDQNLNGVDKLKVSEIVKIYNGLYLLENPDKEQKVKKVEEGEVKEELSGRVRYKLAKLQDNCEPVMKAYGKSRKAVIEKFATQLKDLTDDQIVASEAFKLRSEELEAIEDHEEDIKLSRFTLSDFMDKKGNLLISQKVLNDLSVLIDE